MIRHMCYRHPRGKRWVDGPASKCPYHDKPTKNMGGWRVGK